VLSSFVSEQIQETIFDLMRWDEGDFDFEAIPEAVEEDIGLSVSIENVIMEGSRRLEEWTRIKKKIPSVDVVFKMATAPSEGTFEISLKPTEWNLLLLIDGTRSVAELAHETERTDLEVARIIYGLFSAGLLEFATDEEVGRLRSERGAREERLAVLEAERRIVEEHAAAAALQASEEARVAEERAQEAALAADECAREAARIAAEEASSADQSSVAPLEPRAEEPEVPSDIEVPEFLGGMSSAPNADDAAVLEEMMDAVLHRAAVPAPEVAGVSQPIAEPAAPANTPSESVAPANTSAEAYVPDEAPAFMAVDYEDVTELPMMQVPSVDDLLMDLAELQSPGEASAADAADDAAADAAAADATASAVAAWSEAEPDLSVADESALGDLRASLSTLGMEPVAAEPVETAEASSSPSEPAVESGAAPEPEATEAPVEIVKPEPAPLVAVEPAPAPMSPMSVAERPADFERDLMSLGLGELPADIFGSGADLEPDMTIPPAEPTYEWVDSSEPEVAPEAAEPLATAEASDAPDFSELLESLDVEPEPEYSEPATPPATPTFDIALEAGFDEELLRDDVPAETGGVISTDEYLDDFDFSGGLTDELSALTGADRPNRPTANVNRIPASGEVLHRDSRVDKDTLLKIIDGIKNL